MFCIFFSIITAIWKQWDEMRSALYDISYFIVKLRQGLGKDGQGMAPKAKGLKA